VTAQLVRVSDGRTLWSAAHERRIDDVFAVQGELARAVAATLKLKLLPRDAESLRDARGTSPEVYSMYLRGRSEVEAAELEGRDVPTAALERAVALDPAFAPAWAALADALATRASQELAPAGGVEALVVRAFAAADRAIELDPALNQAYLPRGRLRIHSRWDLPGAKSDFERTLALNPSSASGHREMGRLLGIMGRREDGLRWTRRATELDPLDPRNWSEEGWSYLELRQFARAREAVRGIAESSPSFHGAAVVTALSLLHEGRADEARGVFRRLTNPFDRAWGEALAAAALGDRKAALAGLQAMLDLGPDYAPAQVAQVYAALGESGRSLDWLERAFNARDATLLFVYQGPLFLRLQGEARYQVLLEKLRSLGMGP
jgi:tetratricopeptide (TPR) repeat protein